MYSAAVVFSDDAAIFQLQILISVDCANAVLALKLVKSVSAAHPMMVRMIPPISIALPLGAPEFYGMGNGCLGRKGDKLVER